MIYTIDCPAGHRIVRTFGMVESTTVVGISEKTAWRRFAEGPGPSHHDAMVNLGNIAPDGANAIVGVRVSTTTFVDGEGTISLAMTYIGTPVELDPAPPMSASPVDLAEAAP